MFIFCFVLEGNIELCEKMMTDEIFLNKLKQKLLLSKTLIVESKLEGASLYRDLCKLLNNFLSIEFDELYDDDEEDTTVIQISKSLSKTIKNAPAGRMALFEFFCSYLELPQFFIDFLKLTISSKSNLKALKEVINY